MKQYLDFAKHILEEGNFKPDRTNTGTYSVFGYQMRFNLKDGFPLVTTKKVNFKAVVHELLWFISGDTNIKYLVDNNVNIWNDWPYAAFKKSDEYNNQDMKEYAALIRNDPVFAKKYGELGPVYGKQWRNFDGIDQLANLVKEIKTNPFSRRLIISAWNPAEVKNMALPPCHTLMQLYVNQQNELSCQLYQRSGDAFLGVPFNIASYALFTFMLAHVCHLKVGDFVHTFGDAHIYQNHLEQIKLQLSRKPKPLPTLRLNKDVKSIFDFKFDDITLENYEFWPAIKGEVAV